MPRHNILCGGASAATTAEGKTLLLNVYGEDRNIDLKMMDIRRPMVSSVPDVLMDLLEVAAYVYCADQHTSRGGSALAHSGSGWRPQMHFTIPVRDPDLWNSAIVKETLQDTLYFLSEHYSEFTFVQGTAPLSPDTEYLQFDANGDAGMFVPDHVALFSGGLDSFAGAVDYLSAGKKLALVGHHSCPKVYAYQKELIAALQARGFDPQMFYVPVKVTNHKNDDPAEYTQRTRSFLFASLAMTIAHLFGKDEVIFFENGMVSLNLPISTDVVGARATRTTHPRVLHGFQSLFTALLKKPVTVHNPYIWQTKAEVAALLSKHGCAELVGATRSCTRPRQSTIQYTHCGVCSQCIDRRFGILAAGLGEHDPATQYRVELLLGPRPDPKHVSMAAHYVRFARDLAQTSLIAFQREFPNAFDSVEYFPGLTADQALENIYHLHQRHASDVNAVIDRALKEYSQKIADGTLAPTSVLGLVGNTRSPIEIAPAVDITPAMKDFMDRLSVPPCEFAVDTARKHIVFTGHVVLQNSEYYLIEALVENFRKGKRDPESDISYMAASELARKVYPDGDEQKLRQLITRLRKKLAETLGADFGIPLDGDDIIENHPGSGYRLNRNLREVASAVDLMPKPAMAVTG